MMDKFTFKKSRGYKDSSFIFIASFFLSLIVISFSLNKLPHDFHLFILLLSMITFIVSVEDTFFSSYKITNTKIYGSQISTELDNIETFENKGNVIIVKLKNNSYLYKLRPKDIDGFIQVLNEKIRSEMI